MKYRLIFDNGRKFVVKVKTEDELQGEKERLAMQLEEYTGSIIRCRNIEKIED